MCSDDTNFRPKSKTDDTQGCEPKTCAVDASKKPQATAYAAWPGCAVTACTPDYKVVSGACEPKTCAADATKPQATAYAAWPGCAVTECTPDYKVVSGACVQKTCTNADKGGPPVNGIGWTGNDFNACTPVCSNLSKPNAKNTECIPKTCANDGGTPITNSSGWEGTLGGCRPVCNTGFLGRGCTLVTTALTSPRSIIDYLPAGGDASLSYLTDATVMPTFNNGVYIFGRSGRDVGLYRIADRTAVYEISGFAINTDGSVTLGTKTFTADTTDTGKLTATIMSGAQKAYRISLNGTLVIAYLFKYKTAIGVLPGAAFMPISIATFVTALPNSTTSVKLTEVPPAL
jgi:hypothetical protein